MTYDNLIEFPMSRVISVTEYSAKRRIKAWKGDKFVVQLFKEPYGNQRLQIMRNDIQGDITWDELQAIKSACGFGDVDALEVYPRDKDLMRLGNFRHLWIPSKPITDIVWRVNGDMDGYMERYKTDYAGCFGKPR